MRNLSRQAIIFTTALALGIIPLASASAQQKKTTQKPEPSGSVSNPTLLPD